MSIPIYLMSRLERLEREYNPEFDIGPEPQVNYVDKFLLDAIVALSVAVQDLEERLDSLEAE